MTLKSVFKKVLDALTGALEQRHDPLNPAPEVRQKLEEKGYRFKFNCHAYGRAVITTYTITSPKGERVACFEADKEATAQYRKDYQQAAEACRAQTPKPK